MPNAHSCLPPERIEPLSDGHRRLIGAFRAVSPTVLDHGATLLRAGERPTHAFRLHSGWALRERLLAQGRHACLAVYLPGDLVGFDGLFSTRASDSLVALTQVVFHALPLRELSRLMEQNPAAALRVAHLLDRERQRAERWAVSLGRCDAEARLAIFLLDLHDRLRAHGLVTGRSFRLPMTQKQVGDHLGLTVVHVNRTLRHLREQGTALVSQKTAVITDIDRLRDLADNAIAREAGEEASATAAAFDGGYSTGAAGLSAEPVTSEA